MALDCTLMPRIEMATEIRASQKRCFDLARDLDLHVTSMAHTGERAVAGRTSGLIELGEDVTWRGRHFGFMLEHSSRITAFNSPRHFRDEMVRGHFKTFRHDHFFAAAPNGTRMTDVLEFESPWGVLGRLANVLVLTRYLDRLLRRRAAVVKWAAEAAERHISPSNATGDFYVVAADCIRCLLPECQAPTLMGFDELDEHCYFARQPQTQEQVDAAIAALASACCGALRYRGRDPAILTRLSDLGQAAQIDVVSS